MDNEKLTNLREHNRRVRNIEHSVTHHKIRKWSMSKTYTLDTSSKPIISSVDLSWRIFATRELRIHEKWHSRPMETIAEFDVKWFGGENEHRVRSHPVAVEMENEETLQQHPAKGKRDKQNRKGEKISTQFSFRTLVISTPHGVILQTIVVPGRRSVMAHETNEATLRGWNART